MRILLTGASGFLGSRLAASLVDAGEDVHIVHRNSSALDALTRLGTRLTTHADSGSARSLIDIVGAVRPECVYHLAAHYVAVHASEDVGPLVEGNLLFGSRLFEAMAHAACGNLVVVGTTWQHFSIADPAPTNLYAAMKAAQEAVLSYYVSAHRMGAGILMLTDTYGPDDPRKKLFSLLREASEKGVPLDMSGGEQLLSLTYVDDAISAIVAAASETMGGPRGVIQRWLAKPESFICLKEMVALWQRVTGRHVEVNWGKRPYRPREVMVPWAAGENVPGWKPNLSLEEGIRRMESGNV